MLPLQPPSAANKNGEGGATGGGGKAANLGGGGGAVSASVAARTSAAVAADAVASSGDEQDVARVRRLQEAIEHGAFTILADRIPTWVGYALGDKKTFDKKSSDRKGRESVTAQAPEREVTKAAELLDITNDIVRALLSAPDGTASAEDSNIVQVLLDLMWAKLLPVPILWPRVQRLNCADPGFTSRGVRETGRGTRQGLAEDPLK